MLSDRDQTVAAQAALEKQNQKLKGTVKYLRELVKLQGKATDGTVYTRGSIEAAGRRMMKAAGAKGNVANIMPDPFKLKKEPPTTATTDKPIGDIKRDSFGGQSSTAGAECQGKSVVRP